LDSQWAISLGLGCLQQIPVGGDEGERGQLLAEQFCVHDQGCRQVDGIVAAQFVLLSQVDGYPDHPAIDRNDLVLLVCISQEKPQILVPPLNK
jgi:hypothetical protein